MRYLILVITVLGAMNADAQSTCEIILCAKHHFDSLENKQYIYLDKVNYNYNNFYPERVYDVFKKDLSARKFKKLFAAKPEMNINIQECITGSFYREDTIFTVLNNENWRKKGSDYLFGMSFLAPKVYKNYALLLIGSGYAIHESYSRIYLLKKRKHKWIVRSSYPY